MTEDEVVAELESGMTIGIGGWGSRRKPMSLVRAIARSGLDDLTIVAYGGPDIGLLCATGTARKVAYGFVSLDSIPLEPHFRVARQNAAVEFAEFDEGAFYLGLLAAAHRVPFYPTCAPWPRPTPTPTATTRSSSPSRPSTSTSRSST